MKNKQVEKNFTQTALAVAITMALTPGNSYAGLKLSDIKSLPQTGTISNIRSGKADNGDAVFLWSSDGTDAGQEITSAGSLVDATVEEITSWIAMDETGDFTVDDITPSQTVNTYDFDEGTKPNNSVSFETTLEAVSATNSAGEFVVVWEENKSTSTRKKQAGKKTCYTDDYGYKSCYTSEPSYTYSSTATSSLFAQRYDSDLAPIDSKPLLVASVKKSGEFIENASVDMDDDGDFTVAFSAGKNTYTKDEYGYPTLSNSQSDVLVRQFTTSRGKFAAGKAIKVSSAPKLASGHKLKNSTNEEPSVVVIDESTNAFIVMWHNDYEDTYKGELQNTGECLKYKTYKDSYGYTSQGECIKYKYAAEIYSDSASILKAKRYGN